MHWLLIIDYVSRLKSSIGKNGHHFRSWLGLRLHGGSVFRGERRHLLSVESRLTFRNHHLTKLSSDYLKPSSEDRRFLRGRRAVIDPPY